jgi:hypothetical protein
MAKKFGLREFQVQLACLLGPSAFTDEIFSALDSIGEEEHLDIFALGRKSGIFLVLHPVSVELGILGEPLARAVPEGSEADGVQLLEFALPAFKDFSLEVTVRSGNLAMGHRIIRKSWRKLIPSTGIEDIQPCTFVKSEVLPLITDLRTIEEFSDFQVVEGTAKSEAGSVRVVLTFMFELLTAIEVEQEHGTGENLSCG